MFRLVIFDCDGVLIDSEPISSRVLAEELTRLGWMMSGAECEQRFVGISFYDVRPMIEAHLGCTLPVDWLDMLVARVADTMTREAIAVEGAVAALHSVTALGLDWCVASNSSYQEMDAKFGCTGLSALVAGRVHSAVDVIAEGGQGKPAPDLFLRAARSARVEPAACVVIEDSVVGARAAAAAGMACWALCPRGDGAALAAEGALVFRSLAELPALLSSATANRR